MSSVVLITNWSKIEKELYLIGLKKQLENYTIKLQDWNYSFDISKEDLLLVSGHIKEEDIRWLNKNKPLNMILIGINLFIDEIIKITKNLTLDVFDHMFMVSNTPYNNQLIKLNKFIGSPFLHLMSGLLHFNDKFDETLEENEQIAIFLDPLLHDSPRKIYKNTRIFETIAQNFQLHFIRTFIDGSKYDEFDINNIYADSIENNIYHHSNIDSKFLLEICQRSKYIISETLLGVQIAGYLKKPISNIENFDENITKEIVYTPNDNKLISIIKNKLRRTNQITLYNITELQKECEKWFKKIVGCKSEECTGLTDQQAIKVSKAICYQITNIVGSKYEWGCYQRLLETTKFIPEMVDFIYKEFVKDSQKASGEINLDVYNQENFKGLHRSGWQYVIDSMKNLNNPFGVILDTYIDRTFVWGSDVLKEKGIIPYTSPWVGFVHHTFDESFSKNNSMVCIKNPLFIQSLPSCMAIICLTEYLSNQFKKHLSKDFPHIKFIRLYHPSSFVDNQWNKYKFVDKEHIKLVNIGAWYRNPFSIYAIPESSYYEKFSLQGREMHQNFPPNTNINIDSVKLQSGFYNNKWLQYCVDYLRRIGIDSGNYELDNELDQQKITVKLRKMRDSVTILSQLSNDDYDDLLTNCVVFLDLVDASACNTVIECLIRSVPVCVNRIQPVVEYLGEEYPLYYNNIEEIPNLLTKQRVVDAHSYLKNIGKDFLRIENFIYSFQTTNFYKFLKNVQIDYIFDF